MLRSNLPYNLKSLQILRAIGVISVVFFHIGYIRFGSFGVDIFFVISGFVMALVISRGKSPINFAIDRVSRIIPLYWILTTCLLILAAVKPDLLNSTTANLINYLKSILFFPYFKENGALHPMLAVGWTLNYEMFFYFCVLIAIIIARNMYIAIIFALITGSFLLGKFSTNPVLSNFFGNSIVFEFLLGIIGFKIYQFRLFQKLNIFTLITIGLLSLIFITYSEINGFLLDRFILFGLPSVLLLLSATALERKFNHWLANIFVTIGDASYATYLSHYYIVEGIRKIFTFINPYAPFGAIFILFLSLLVGHILYTALDLPLSNYFKKKLRSKLALKPFKV